MLRAASNILWNELIQSIVNVVRDSILFHTYSALLSDFNTIHDILRYITLWNITYDMIYLITDHITLNILFVVNYVCIFCIKLSC